jgi:hypothetical protein
MGGPAMKARPHSGSLVCLTSLALALGGVACASSAPPEDAATRTTSAQLRRSRAIEAPPWRDEATSNALPAAPDPIKTPPPSGAAGTLSATRGPSGAPIPPPAGARSDSDIVAVLEAIVDGELNRSRLAARRARDAGLRDIAAHAADAFGAAGSRLTQSESMHPFVPEATPEASTMRASSTRTTERLRSAGAMGFDEAYAYAELLTSQRLIELLDLMTPDAQMPQLKNELLELRSWLATHLHAVRDVQERLAREH